MTSRRLLLPMPLIWLLLPFVSSWNAPRITSNLRRAYTARNLGFMVEGVTEDEFVQKCAAHLLSDDNIDDGLISQDNFANFLTDYCIELNVCPEGTSFDFEELAVELQLAFVLFLCNESTESERKACLDDLKEMESTFGYDVNEEDPEVLESEVRDLCALAYRHASSYGLLAPTVAPTTIVTPSPSLAPAQTPSENGSPTDGNSDGTPTNGADGATIPVSTTSDSVNTGLVVGLSIAGVVLVLVMAVLVSRRRKRRRGVNSHEKYVASEMDVAGDESIFTEDSDAFKYIPKKIDSFHSAHSKASASAKSHSSSSASAGGALPKDITTGTQSRSVAQFDPSNAAAAIALGIDGRIIRRGSESSSPQSSLQMSLDTGKHHKMKNLTDAIEHGDWDAVANLAGSMASDSEDVSTISDYSSAREQLSQRSGSVASSSLNSGDEARVAEIQSMVELGDWSGVAAAAQYFSSSRSLVAAESGGGQSQPESPKRSFLDFVTGRRTAPSAAATAAIVPVASDLLGRDSEMSEGGLAQVGVEDPPSVADAGHNDTMDTQSSSSRGSQQGKNVASSGPKRSKRWFGKFMSSRASRKASVASKSGDAEVTALEEELNQALERGDWSAIEEISAKLDSPGTRSVSSRTAVRGSPIKDSDQGEEGLLGASSLASMKTPKRAKLPGENPIASQRKAIDLAVSQNDWDAVERLTTQLLNTKPSPTPKDEMMDASIERTPSSKSKSPFRDTPSSSEWTGSPIDKEMRSEKIRKLIAAKDWKGVHVLSGIYEMEAKGTLPPTFASLSNDSGDNPAYAQGWILGGRSNADTSPDSSEDGSARRGQPPPSPSTSARRGQPPPSPSTSTSTNNSSELREFERLVNAKDWRGLAYFAGAEDQIDDDDDEEEEDGTLLPRNLFKIDPLAPPKPPPAAAPLGEEEHVELRHTEIQKKQRSAGSDDESIHGVPPLIDHWEHKIEKHTDSPPASSKKGAKDEKKK